MSGVEFIQEDLTTHPECVHGPSFLFEKNTSKGSMRFFACSACRDRKDCPFFLPEEDIERSRTKEAKQLIEKKKAAYVSEINHTELRAVLLKVKTLPESARRYCFTCDKFIVSESHDSTHDIVTGISDTQLDFPTKLLSPLENDKVEAQYLFDDSAIRTTVQILNDFGFKNVLCIGTPRIFEHVRANGFNTLLLDFDKRYHNFFGPEEFCWYNLFNDYFFFRESRDVFHDFMKNDTVLLIDPPFGGRLEPISVTIDAIEKHSATKPLPVVFYFPYFMEPHFRNHLPGLKMTDYKVNYENHFLFSGGAKGRKYGSAVRIFTNLDFKKLRFDDDAYRYCNICERYVYKENEHCYLCNRCTSKDGRTYTHCNRCKACVKPTWVHCTTCKKCAQPNHDCATFGFNRSCFHCHEKGHKKNDCPKVNIDVIKKIRKEKCTNSKKIKRLQ